MKNIDDFNQHVANGLASVRADTSNNSNVVSNIVDDIKLRLDSEHGTSVAHDDHTNHNDHADCSS